MKSLIVKSRNKISKIYLKKLKNMEKYIILPKQNKFYLLGICLLFYSRKIRLKLVEIK